MNWRTYIQTDPKVMAGKPVIKGTRITVEQILERLGDGWSEADLIKSFPQLTPEHIRAAFHFASRALANDETIYLSESA